MEDRWTDRLSEYLDDDLPGAERAGLERHLATCARCTRILEELRAVTARAVDLPAHEPSDDLWPGIEARIAAAAGDPDAPGRRRTAVGTRVLRLARLRVSLSMPQAAAAAFALALLSGGGVWLALQATPGRVPPAVTAPARPGGATGASFADFGQTRYDAAIADLQRVLQAHRSDLDTSTVRVLEQNLALIDRAVEQARRALAADPASPYLNGYLADSMRRKYELLRRATATLAAAG